MEVSGATCEQAETDQRRLVRGCCWRWAEVSPESPTHGPSQDECGGADKLQAVSWGRWLALSVATVAGAVAVCLAVTGIYVATTSLRERSSLVRIPQAAQESVPASQLSQEEEDEGCLRQAGCHGAYPKPYDFGRWPKDYDYSGSFPKGFIWGLSTAAYQVEGAYRDDGRGASIWDTFTGADTVGMPGANCSYCCKKAPCPINAAMAASGATGNVASDHYHMVGVDVALMKSMGLKHYSFSISWPRIFPTGRAADGVNQQGLDFYSRLIEKLLAAGITPHVTLYHWDLPQGLLDPPSKQAWWARHTDSGEPKSEILGDFLAYADTCFAEFGSRVKWWTTFREPWTFTYLASDRGQAPCLPKREKMSVDPFIAGHNVLNAHAAVVDLYRRKYQRRQGGKIGIVLGSFWREPQSTDPGDVAAAARGMLFQLGWFADPIFGGRGEYPEAMQDAHGTLPRFTDDQRRLLNGSADFLGLSHSGTRWATYSSLVPGPDHSYSTLSEEPPLPGVSRHTEWSIRKILNYVDRRYKQPPIYLVEAGQAWPGAREVDRMHHYAAAAAELRRTIHEDGVDVRGFFAGSLLDGFEWSQGYGKRYGVVHNDFAFGIDKHAPKSTLRQPTPRRQVRTRKKSSCLLEDMWTSNALVDPWSKDFRGCPEASIIDGHYKDEKHHGCDRSVVVDKYGTTGHISGTDSEKDLHCDGKHDKAWGPFPAMFSGGTIAVDFSSAGGPPSLAGFWDRSAKAIIWADGNLWTRIQELAASHES